MEHNKESKEAYKKHIDKLVKPIFDKVLKEANIDTMSVGNKPISFLWRPNNYRIQIPFNTIKFKRNTTKEHHIKTSNYGTKFTLKNLDEATIMLDIPKKKTAKLTVIYKPKKRFYYNITTYSIKELENRINQRVNEIESKMLSSVNKFTKLVGGEAEVNKRKWMRHEDDIHGESFIDSLPPDLVIHDTYFKKVYQKGVEFKGPVYVKNYIANRAIEDLSPEIASSINNLGVALLEKLNPSIENLSMNMQTHVSIMKKIEQGITKFNKTVNKLNNKLDQKKLNEYF